MPAARAAASTAWSGSTTRASRTTSLPSSSPKPPGSRKSRCRSMMRSAVRGRLEARTGTARPGRPSGPAMLRGALAAFARSGRRRPLYTTPSIAGRRGRDAIPGRAAPHSVPHVPNSRGHRFDLRSKARRRRGGRRRRAMHTSLYADTGDRRARRGPAAARRRRPRARGRPPPGRRRRLPRRAADRAAGHVRADARGARRRAGDRGRRGDAGRGARAGRRGRGAAPPQPRRRRRRADERHRHRARCRCSSRATRRPGPRRGARSTRARARCCATAPTTPRSSRGWSGCATCSGPALDAALARTGPLDLIELQRRGAPAPATSATTARTRARALLLDALAGELPADVRAFILGNHQFFLNVGDGRREGRHGGRDGRAGLAARDRGGAQRRRGRRASSRARATRGSPARPRRPTRRAWSPGYAPDDMQRDLGDSAIVEVYGLGALAVGGVAGVGAVRRPRPGRRPRDHGAPARGSPRPSIPSSGGSGGRRARPRSSASTRGPSSATGIVPPIHTGIAHRAPGVGQIGGGVTLPPLEAFAAAVRALDAAPVARLSDPRGAACGRARARQPARGAPRRPTGSTRSCAADCCAARSRSASGSSRSSSPRSSRRAGRPCARRCAGWRATGTSSAARPAGCGRACPTCAR